MVWIVLVLLAGCHEDVFTLNLFYLKIINVFPMRLVKIILK